MNIEWLKGLKGEEEKAERRQLVQSHAAVLQVLSTILKRKHEEALVASQSKERFQSPSWAYEQADYNAVMRTLRDILALTDLTED